MTLTDNETINLKLIEPIYALFFVNNYSHPNNNLNKYKKECYSKTEILVKELYKGDVNKLEYALKNGCTDFINHFYCEIDSTCSICQEDNDNNSKSYGCYHCFHKECYYEYRSNIQDNNKKCPICRSEFNDNLSVENNKYYDHLSPEFNRFAGTRFLGLYSPFILDELVNYHKNEKELKLAVARAWYSFSYRLREDEPDMAAIENEQSNNVLDGIYVNYTSYSI